MTDVLQKLIEAEKTRLQVGPECLSDVIYRWNLMDFLEYADRPCNGGVCIGVSELVYCSNKYYLRHRYPELVLAENLYASWAVYGRLIHRGLENLLREHGFRTEAEVSRQFLVDGLLVMVNGRIDALGTWNGRLTAVEIKSSRSDNDLPRQQHILQLRIYMNLAKASQGILIYITPDRVTEYTIAEPISDPELKILIQETINNTKHPRYPWECSYCSFNHLCPYKQTNNSYSKRR